MKLLLCISMLFVATSAQSGWGTVVSTDGGLQATSWAAQVESLSDASEAPLFQSSSPTLPNAPALQDSGTSPVDLKAGAYRLGNGQNIQTRAACNKFPQSDLDNELTDVAGVSYARSYAASLDIEIPYTAANINGGIQQSPIGVHLVGVTVTAISIPGKSVIFDVKAEGGGYVSVDGKVIAQLPAVWPRDFRLRIPKDISQPAIAEIIFNEQVTTDIHGTPMTDSNGKFLYDTKATSGYVNAVRMIIYGKEVGEVTLLHAAVIRDPSLTEK